MSSRIASDQDHVPCVDVPKPLDPAGLEGALDPEGLERMTCSC